MAYREQGRNGHEIVHGLNREPLFNAMATVRTMKYRPFASMGDIRRMFWYPAWHRSLLEC